MSAPERVGVLGGGRMGAGIAHAFLMAGSQVRVVERDGVAVDAARERIAAHIDRSLARGARTFPREDLAERVTVGSGVDTVAASDLVIEALPEDRALKIEFIRRVARVVTAGCVIASNTSSISVTSLASAVSNPERMIGMHFFNPVPASALVELVLAEQTAPTLVEKATGWVDALGKAAIVVRDTPGFASSRLGVALGLEAIRMVEEGVASPADIDRAMELGYRHPMGPLRTTDIVGLDVRLGIAEELHAAYGDRFAPPETLRKMVAEGRLGRKSGRGFYEWSQ